MTTQPSSPPAQVDYARLWWIGLVANVAAIAANLITRTLIRKTFRTTPGFPGFTTPAITLMTTLGMGGATLAFAPVARVSREPARAYTWVSLVALVISCIPNVIFARDPKTPSPIPGTGIGTWRDWSLLIIFHVIAAAIAVWLLPRAQRR